MKPYILWGFVVTVLMLAGCANTSLHLPTVLAVPLQPTLQQEVLLARMEQILSSKRLSIDERAQLLYERGVLYDSMGLRALARNDFTLALTYRPDMPDIFNYLGVYFTEAANYDAAYEAFDSVLELDPTLNYAYLNRGIAFYYGSRYKLAQDDLLAFYHVDPNDPFSCLWLYLAESKLDTKQALQALLMRYNNAKKGQWGWKIVEFYLGDISEQSLYKSLHDQSPDNTSLAEHLSETNFYLGKYYLSLGEKNNAAVLFKLAVANNVHNFVENRYALLELAKLGQTQDDLSESDQQ